MWKIGKPTAQKLKQILCCESQWKIIWIETDIENMENVGSEQISYKSEGEWPMLQHPIEAKCATGEGKHCCKALWTSLTSTSRVRNFYKV